MTALRKRVNYWENVAGIEKIELKTDNFWV